MDKRCVFVSFDFDNDKTLKKFSFFLKGNFLKTFLT